MVKVIIMACVILHNILRNKADQNVSDDQHGNQAEAMLQDNDNSEEGMPTDIVLSPVRVTTMKEKCVCCVPVLKPIHTFGLLGPVAICRMYMLLLGPYLSLHSRVRMQKQAFPQKTKPLPKFKTMLDPSTDESSY